MRIWKRVRSDGDVIPFHMSIPRHCFVFWQHPIMPTSRHRDLLRRRNDAAQCSFISRSLLKSSRHVLPSASETRAALDRLTDDVALAGEDGVLELVRHHGEFVLGRPVNCDGVVGRRA